MKKNVFKIGGLTLLIVAVVSFSSSGSDQSLEPGAGLNTGPAKVVDCKWWFTGDKKICMSENTNPCTETKCF